jgi:sn-glycerol 3-phosphate transport system permease protein
MKLSRKILTFATGYILIFPSMLFLASFTYYPIIRSLFLSLFQQIPGSDYLFTGLWNYVTMFESGLFRQVMANNLVYALGSTIPSIFFGLIFALLLNDYIGGRGFFRFSFFYPTMIPIAAASMVWIFLFTQSYGLVNKILDILHFRANIDWLNSTPFAMIAIICVSIWKFSGYYMLLFLSGLQSIDPTYYEAAQLEGASIWHKIYKITLPLLSPTTFFIVLMAIINSFQAVDQIYVMTRGGPYNTTNVLLYYIYQHGFVYWDIGIASSASSVLFIILLFITIIYYRGLQHFVYYER